MVTCGIDPTFDVKDAAGVLLPEGVTCRSPCDVVRKAGPLGCPGICAYPNAISLEPGEAYHTSYSGLYVVQQRLPEQCIASDYDDGASCEQLLAIQPGSFTFMSRAGTVLDCSGLTGMCSTCTPTGSGGCTTPASLIGGKMLSATTSVYLDGSYGVYGQPQPAPLPLPAGGTGNGGAVARATVELVFIDE